MVAAWLLAALLLTSGVASAQTPGVLRVTVTLPDATQTLVPIAKHALLISDNPPTREPRRLVTSAKGEIVVNLPPGSYIVESDAPVAFSGRAYQWTAIVEVVGGQDTALALTAQNAEALPLTAATTDPRRAAPDPSAQADKWQASVVTIWSPTSRASGFVVDAKGLVATARNSVGNAATVEVQLSPTVKVPARVLVADSTQDAAILWIDPTALNQAAPLPLACPPATTPSLEEGDDVVALAASLQEPGDALLGEITGFHPRGIETDLPLAFGDAGGPVFSSDHASVVGLTFIRSDADASRRGDALVARAGIICEALSAARAKMPGATAPTPTPLPVEPARPYPTDSTAPSTQASSGIPTTPVVSSSNFDVALITPRTILRAREKADWTGGRSVRPTEAEARLGRVTDFGSWAEYFADAPAVLVVRVAPKLVEGFWMRIAREAARTQGAALPPLKDFKTSFLRLRASCGSADVTPIHPFVLEHLISGTRIVREGLYVFSPDAFGPHCGSVTLTLSSEQAPEKADTLTIDPKAIEQIWQDFAAYRAAAR
jgi:S1-C subfamily serine protease